MVKFLFKTAFSCLIFFSPCALIGWFNCPWNVSLIPALHIYTSFYHLWFWTICIEASLLCCNRWSCTAAWALFMTSKLSLPHFLLLWLVNYHSGYSAIYTLAIIFQILWNIFTFSTVICAYVILYMYITLVLGTKITGLKMNNWQQHTSFL